MTFLQMLRLIEDYGALNSLSVGGTSQVRLNGAEYNRKGIRSNYSAPEENPLEQKPKKSAEKIYLGKSAK
jgi:hypothetical protein